MLARQVLITGILAVVVAVPATGGAQSSAGRSKLIVTVADPSGAVIPAATVTVAGLEPAGKAVAVPPAKTGDNGLVTFERLIPGRYSIAAEFEGFDQGLLRDVRLRPG